MKKLFITLLVTGLISYLFGNYIFTTYKKNLENVVKRVSSTYETVYMLQYGSYKNREKALDNDLEVSYILEKEDGFYKIYIGVTKNLEIANKIRGIYKKTGNDIYIKEKLINDIEFLSFLENYDETILKSNDEETINVENDVINKYKELVLNE